MEINNCIEEASEGRSRKRKRQPDNWTRTKLQKSRYTSKSLPKMPTCGHNTPTFKCSTIGMQDIRKFHQAFYETSRKVIQDCFILKYTSQHVPKRQTRSKVPDSSRKSSANRYYIQTKSGPTQVCAKTFLDILGISRYRVQNLCRTHLKTGASPKERRGGDRRTTIYETRKQAVIDFVKTLKPVESHYTRDKTSRLYLSAGLNMKRLWRMYNEMNDNVSLRVKYHYFRQIFNYNFNISFKSPSTDACSTCIEVTNKIKLAKSSKEKSDLMIQLRVHKLKASAFYSMVKETDDHVKIFSFDCQKNLILPKVPDQSAYYSRQLYQYNCTICSGSSRGPQNMDTVKMYTWLENERYKGSNEISSCVLDTLKNADYSGIKIIRLCADGCAGQNKNSMLIGMLMKWFQEFAPENVRKIELVFPVVGHSFLPPDRVFGRIEQRIKKLDTIINPEDYIIIFKEFGTVKKLGTEVPALDWKTTVQKVLKPTNSWHFKLSSSKRIILTKSTNGNILVRGEPHYKTDTGVAMSLFKKYKSSTDLIPAELQNKVPVKETKLKDVDKLLSKHFGNAWRDLDCLNYYKNVIDDQSNQCDVINGLVNEDDLESESAVHSEVEDLVV